MNDLTLKQAPVLLWLLNFGIIREGFNKKKKKSGIFHKGGGVPTDFGSVSILFFFIFKHGLNHPEMQRNFFLPLGDPPPSLTLSVGVKERVVNF